MTNRCRARRGDCYLSWSFAARYAPDVFLSGLLGSLVAGLATGVGALPIFVKPRWGNTGQVVLLALAAGVMLGATFFSLLQPALEIAQARWRNPITAVGVVGVGVLLGGAAIGALHTWVPHEHFVKGREGPSPKRYVGKSWLFVLAISLHNLPEGMSVGVAYGDDVRTGLAVTLGIGLQNMPEGLAVAAALLSDGYSRARSFLIATLTGLVEPIGGFVGALAVSLSASLLPWALAFAAGAMLYVISGEVIPETHRDGLERVATFSLLLGFVLMLWLDAGLG